MFESLNSQHLYIAHSDYLEPLCQELGEVTAVYGNLVFSPVNRTVSFAADRWLNFKMVPIQSIGDAAKILKAEKVVWHANIVNCARRTTLISEKLPLYRNKPLTFPPTRQIPRVECFSLLDEHTLIYSEGRACPMPNGEYHFVEDKEHPPNRAYLKLWEALVRLGRYPKSGELALDLGASPGGWTYVLQSCGAKVIAVDKAPLDHKIARLPGVETLLQSAFSLQPKDFGKIDWFVCDVACYPNRLYDFLQPWMASGKVEQFICTIKLQGDTDFAAIQKFQAIPNSTIVHLFNNKHELTWFYPNLFL